MTEETTITAKDINAMTGKQLDELVEENKEHIQIEGFADMKVAEKKAALIKALELGEKEEEEEEAEPEAKTKKTKGVIYTYVGKGADSPRVINLMGEQKFVRGKATEVTSPNLLAKLPGMTTFVKGEADQETLHQIDEDGRVDEEEARVRDKNAEKQYLANLRKLKEAQ